MEKPTTTAREVLVREVESPPQKVSMDIDTIEAFQGIYDAISKCVGKIFHESSNFQTFKLPSCCLSITWGGEMKEWAPDNPPEWAETQEKRFQVIKRITDHLQEYINMNIWGEETIKKIKEERWMSKQSEMSGETLRKIVVLESIQHSILERVDPLSDTSEMIEAWYALGALLVSLSRGPNPLMFKDSITNWLLPIIVSFSTMISKTIIGFADVSDLSVVMVGFEPKEREFWRLKNIFKMKGAAFKYAVADYSHVPGRSGFFTDVAVQDVPKKYYSENEALFFALIRDAVRVVGREKVEQLIQLIVDVWLDVLLHNDIQMGEDDWEITVNSNYATIIEAMYSEIDHKIENKVIKDTISFIIYTIFKITARFSETLATPVRTIGNMYTTVLHLCSYNAARKNFDKSRTSELFFDLCPILVGGLSFTSLSS